MQNIVTWGQNMKTNIQEFACFAMGGLFSGMPPQQRSDNLPRHDDAPGPQEGGYVVFLSSSNQKVINRYVLYVKHTLIT